MTKKITERQSQIMRALEIAGPMTSPRGTLERLAKKGFVIGDKKSGWSLSDAGRSWLADADRKNGASE